MNEYATIVHIGVFDRVRKGRAEPRWVPDGVAGVESSFRVVTFITLDRVWRRSRFGSESEDMDEDIIAQASVNRAVEPEANEANYFVAFRWACRSRRSVRWLDVSSRERVRGR